MNSKNKLSEHYALKFQTPEEMAVLIDDYFAQCDATVLKVPHKQLSRSTDAPVFIEVTRPYTVDGLCHHLGTQRTTLLDYQKREGYKELVDAAKMKISMHQIEMSLVGAYDQRVLSLMLINNHEYVNESRVDVTSRGEALAITGMVIKKD